MITRVIAAIRLATSAARRGAPCGLDGPRSLEDELEVAAKAASAGELDGDEVAPDGSQASIYLTTRNADLLVKTIDQC